MEIISQYFINNDSSKQEALVSYYGTLLSMLTDYNKCDELIDYICDNNLDVSSDFIVHTLNGLGYIKRHLLNWDKLVEFSHQSMISSIGNLRADKLIKIYS